MNPNLHNESLQKLTEEELSFSYPHDDYELWMAALTSDINDLILSDFGRLISVLYKLDINETKLKTIIDEHRDSDASELIGNLIIERQLQKIKTREMFKQNDKNIDENEKW